MKRLFNGCWYQYTILVYLIVIVWTNVPSSTALSQIVNSTELQDAGGTEFITSSNSTSNSTISSSLDSDDETSWEDGNWRRKDGSKIAAIAVYCSVVLIALFGILIKYFFTQYETLQAKAQLEYQQLRNVHIQ